MSSILRTLWSAALLGIFEPRRQGASRCAPVGKLAVSTWRSFCWTPCCSHGTQSIGQSPAALHPTTQWLWGGHTTSGATRGQCSENQKWRSHLSDRGRLLKTPRLPLQLSIHNSLKDWLHFVWVSVFHPNVLVLCSVWDERFSQQLWDHRVRLGRIEPKFWSRCPTSKRPGERMTPPLILEKDTFQVVQFEWKPTHFWGTSIYVGCIMLYFLSNIKSLFQKKRSYNL